MFAPAIGRVAVRHGRRCHSRVRTLVAQGTHADRSGFARSQREHRHGRVVGVSDAAGHHVRGNQLDQRAQQPCDVAEPFGQLSAIEIEAAAGVNFDLAIERKMVAGLPDRDVGEEVRIHHAARDRQLRHRRLHHRRTWRMSTPDARGGSP